MARNFPEKYKSKLETLKRAIIIRSPLRSEIGENNIAIRELWWDYDSTSDNFYELTLEVTITDLECENCYFDVEDIGKTLGDIVKTLGKSTKLKLSPQLSIGGGNSLRGIATYEVIFREEKFEKIVFGLIYDPGLEPYG
jgi:hypothetical protein